MAKKDERYEVTIRVLSHDGQPAVGLTVNGFDQDRGRAHDPLGQATTDGDGIAVIGFTGGQAGGSREGAPEYFHIITDGTGILVQSIPISLPPGATTLPDLRLPRPLDFSPGGGGPAPAPSPSDPSSTPGDNRIHGSRSRDVIVPRSSFHRGPFGRLFRKLAPWTPPGADEGAKVANVRAIAATMVEDPGQPDTPAGENPAIPVGYTYFGQFVDHDITFDPTSSLMRLNDPDRLTNFRTPRFDLDNLYGEGPDDEPFLYDQQRGREGMFLIGKGLSPNEDDLPRNNQHTALIGDPRNDENIIVAQMQLVFLKLHNRILARVVDEETLTGREAFLRAQTLLRWHYQWVVLYDFLPRICGPDVAKAVAPKPGAGQPATISVRFYDPKNAPFMPVEFSAAAYRFGHSQIRERYDLNDIVRGVPIFVPPETNPGVLTDLRGFRRLPGVWTLDWRHFLPIDMTKTPQASRRIDPKLSRALSALPTGPNSNVGVSLAQLNLLRGFRLGLPSGQAVARAMGVDPLANDSLGLDPALAGTEAPLWYYILKEAEIVAEGAHLGPVGGRIVAETLAGLADGDPSGFLAVEPGWRPSTAFKNGSALDASGDDLQLAGLIRAAGAGGDPFARTG